MDYMDREHSWSGYDSGTDECDSGSTSPSFLDREGVLTVLGYRSEKIRSPSQSVLIDPGESCVRCGKKVYPVEKIDVGTLYHKGCFKCRECAIQLTLKSFYREGEPDSGQFRDVFCLRHVPKHESAPQDAESMGIRRAMTAQRHASASVSGLRVTAEYGGSGYGADALEFQHFKKNESTRRKRTRRSKRRSTLRSYKDFEEFGVFDAQKALEKDQRVEEDELYRQMYSERGRQMASLQQQVDAERRATVADLVAWFEQKGACEAEIQEGLKKVESYYGRQQRDWQRLVLQRLTIEEQAAVARMIAGHCQEMLVLIAEKEQQAEEFLQTKIDYKQILDEEQQIPSETESSLTALTRLSKSQERLDEETSISQSGPLDDSPYKGSFLQVHGEKMRRREDKMTLQRWGMKGSVGEEGTDDEGVVFLKEWERSLNNSPARAFEGFVDSAFRDDDHRQSVAAVTASSLLDDSSTEEEEEDQRHVATDSLQRLKGAPVFGTLDLHRKNQIVTEKSGAESQSEVKAVQRENVVSSTGQHGKITISMPGQNPNIVITSTDSQGNSTSQVTLDPMNIGQNGDLNSANNGHSSGKISITRAAGTSTKLRIPVQVTPGDQNTLTDEALVDDAPMKRKHDKQDAASRDQQSAMEQNENRQIVDKNIDDIELRRNVDRYMDRTKRNQLPGRQQRNSSPARHSPTMQQRRRDRHAPERIREVPRIKTMVRPGEVPPAEPPENKKDALFSSPDVFKPVDDRAVAESKKDHSSFTELVRKLTKNCEDEIQKVRGVYRWITAKDLNTLRFSEELNPDSPFGLLRGIKMGTESYHNLFKRLCSYAGLHCEIIEGFSKGVGYRPGMRLKGNTFRNRWTAVCVEGSWRFINCNWGSRHVSGPEEEKFIYKCDEFYFFTDSDEHIYQHFPDQPIWQLLEKTITLEAFWQLPLVKSPFFTHKLKFESSYSSIVVAAGGCTELSLISPKWKKFGYTLRSITDKVDKEKLADRVLMRKIEKKTSFKVNLPDPGQYYLDVFISPLNSSDNMEHACAFMLACDQISQTSQFSFPILSVFGRTPLCKNYHITAKTLDPYVIVSGQSGVELKFAVDSEIRLGHKFQVWNHKEKSMIDQDRFAFPVVRSQTHVTYIFSFTRRVCYSFTLFGFEDEESPPDLLFRYFFEVHTPSEVPLPFPKTSKRWRNCRLYSPLTGDLRAWKKTGFRLECQDALEVALSINGNWWALQSKEGAWEGTVPVSQAPGKVIAYGRFDASKEKYMPLLEFAIKDLAHGGDCETSAKILTSAMAQVQNRVGFPQHMDVTDGELWRVTNNLSLNETPSDFSNILNRALPSTSFDLDGDLDGNVGTCTTDEFSQAMSRNSYPSSPLSSLRRPNVSKKRHSAKPRFHYPPQQKNTFI